METHPGNALSDYAARFHAAIGPEQVCVSPLGAWLLLALVAPIAEGERREQMERALGEPAEHASMFARELLSSEHPAIALALGAWLEPSFGSIPLDIWLAALPDAVAQGPIPRDLDAWVKRATRGAIDRFPIALSPDTMFVLAAALAVDGKWSDPLELVPSAKLGETPWAGRVKSALSDRMRMQPHCLYHTKSAGLVGAHEQRTTEAFTVLNVIADPAVPHDRVLAAAYEVAAGIDPVSLFDLPLGDGHSWTITEEEVTSYSRGQRTESGRAVLPAWESAPETIDLLAYPALGIRDAAETLLALLPPNPLGYEARAAQSNVARYDRHGFSAASVSAIEMRVGASWHDLDDRGVNRHIDLRFGRPYAALVVSESPTELLWRRGTPGVAKAGPSPWIRIPLFSAWVTTPIEPDGREPEDRRSRRRQLSKIQRMP